MPASMRPYGIALGGLVPRHDSPLMEDVVQQAVDTGLPVHVMGIGEPGRVTGLWDKGVHSVDSSKYAHWAVGG